MAYNLTLSILNETLIVCRLDRGAQIPEWAIGSEWFSVTKTDEELSIVCVAKDVPENVLETIVVENGWRGFKVEGPLDFGLVGILSHLSGLMAAKGVSIFAVSTYDTDYLLVKEDNIEVAALAFEEALIKINR